jgi:hypothetical protein
VEEVISAIQALDLESVKARVMDAELGEGWSREYADSIEVAYKNYLTMLVKYQDNAEDIMLSKDADEFWHTHILQTMKYADDCEKVFGTFLHHNPHIGERTPEVLRERVELAEKTRLLYEREFGSGQHASEAWYGATDTSAMALGSAIKAGEAAMSAVTIGPQKAAMSAVAIRPESAAMSAVTIRAPGAAMSAVAIKAEKAAMSAVAIRPERAAMSAVAIRAENAAMSAVSISAEHAAMSAVAIRAEHAAMSAVTIPAEQAQLSAAA